MTNVLIIESEPAFAQELESGLQHEGCAVTTFADGKEAILYAAETPPDLVIVTAELPKMNGFTVCNRLRRADGLQTTPIVLLSADASEETFAQHSRMEGKRADAYLHKPIRFEDLAPTLRQFIPLGGASRPSVPAPHSDGPPFAPQSSASSSVGALLAEVEPPVDDTSNALNLVAQEALEEIAGADGLEELDLGELEELPLPPLVADENIIEEQAVDAPELAVDSAWDSAVSAPDETVASTHVEQDNELLRNQLHELQHQLQQAQASHQTRLSELGAQWDSERHAREQQLRALGEELELLRTQNRPPTSPPRAGASEDVDELRQALDNLQREYEGKVGQHQHVLDALRAENAATVSRLEAEQAAALHNVNLEHQKRMQVMEREAQKALRANEEHHHRLLADAEQKHQDALSGLGAQHQAALAQAVTQHNAALAQFEEQARSALSQKDEEHSQTLGSVQADHAQALATLQRERDALAQSAADEQTRLQTQFDELRTSSEAAAERARQNHEQAQGQIATLTSDLQAAAESIQQLRQQVGTLEEQLELSQAEVSTLLEQRDKAQSALRELQAALRGALARVDQACT